MLIGSLSNGTFTVTRTAGAPLVLGRYSSGAVTTFPIVAIEQPYSPRTMIPLPEGVRVEDVKLIHTNTPLRTRDENGEADSISIRGENFIVWRVDGPYTLGGSAHYEVHAARKNKP